MLEISSNIAIMKNAGNIISIACSVFCFIFGVFLSSCGLEEVLTVEEPTVTYNYPSYDSSDYLTWYISFKTSSDSGESFIGTDVYYKIYNSSSSLTSQRAAINALNTSSNSSSDATKMIDSYSYQPLGASKSTGNSVYFPESGRTVVLRLKTYLSADSSNADSDSRYQDHACVGVKSDTSYDYKEYIPFRNGNKKSFDFFDANDDDDSNACDVLPEFGDSDYFCAESDKDKTFDEYYVQLFAVGVALNPETVTASYSHTLDLGAIPIRREQ